MAVPTSTNRRDFLEILVGGAAGLSLAPSAFGQTPIAASKLADNFFLITGAGSNVLLVTGPDSSLMVDGGSKEHSADLLKVVAGESKMPVKILFNTHWHWDHTGLNEALGQAGAKIIAHEFTKQWLGTEIDSGWEKKTYEPLPKEALPTDTFYGTPKKTMMFGQEPIEYSMMPQAHTDGDIYVYFSRANVLMAGDVVSGWRYPVLDYTTDGWINGMLSGQKTLLGLANADTKIIPGTGPVQTKADLQAQNEALTTMRDILLKLMKSGNGPKEMIAAKPLKEFDQKWGNPDQFIFNAYKGLWGHVRELGGIV
jgi:glyoxylase-like metal-dependent hydrolase (beta-lactamase superfamily II)